MKVKGQIKSTNFQKVKKKDYKKLEYKVEKPENDQRFMNEFLFLYSQNTINDIKQYLKSNIYPQEITSIAWAFIRKNRKRNFRKIVRKNQRF